MYYMKNGKVTKDLVGKDKFHYAIFLSGNDNVGQIEGAYPLIYKTVDDMMKDLSTTEVKSWLDKDNVTIVLRKIEIMDTE